MGRVRTSALFASTLGLMLSLTLGSSGATATQNLCEGFVPQNDMKIPVGDRSHFGMRNNGGVTEAQYNEIMDRIQTMYADVIKQKGGSLVINRLWTDATVNSSATQNGKDWVINMYGGIARHPDVTYEGEALIACHEMGHHLGGAPKIQSVFGGSWATNEGGADYFATLKCLRQLFAADDNAAIVAAATIDPLAKSQCLAQFSVPAEQNICMRNSLAGESVSYLFQDLTKETTRPQFSTPDPTQVTKTNDDHPATQCRMDTYFSGGLCQVGATVQNSDSDFRAGSCVQGRDATGYRPRCWFNPDAATPQPGDGTCPLGDQSVCDELCKSFPTLPFCK